MEHSSAIGKRMGAARTELPGVHERDAAREYRQRRRLADARQGARRQRFAQ